jgi:hypothetical protein
MAEVTSSAMPKSVLCDKIGCRSRADWEIELLSCFSAKGEAVIHGAGSGQHVIVRPHSGWEVCGRRTISAAQPRRKTA